MWFEELNLLHFVTPAIPRDNNFIKDFPQLADGLMVIPLPVEEQCRGVLSEPLPNLALLTGESEKRHVGHFCEIQNTRYELFILLWLRFDLGKSCPLVHTHAGPKPTLNIPFHPRILSLTVPSHFVGVTHRISTSAP